ncbi:SIR2 family protein [Clavibacter sp. Sh2141]|uniref:SIR2 family protein n=1 Tax=Clavibacter sp. Sh2141 TaxID=3395374 RepID=UPI0039BC2BEE
MPALVDLLLHEAPAQVVPLDIKHRTTWADLEGKLRASGDLEGSLADTSLSPELDSIFTDIIASAVRGLDERAISEIVLSDRPTTYGRLFAYILANNKIVEVITTNYDRIIEASISKDGLRLDSMFYGHSVGHLDSSHSRDELLIKRIRGTRGQVRLEYHPAIRLAKPHGSLDWYEIDDRLISTNYPLARAPKVVTPGGDKYIKGYDVLYSKHRNRANAAIDKAAALLVIGYGFNDNHLQTNLKIQMSKVPSVLLTKSLTANAHEFLKLHPDSVAIEDDNQAGAYILHAGQRLRSPLPLWQLDTFMTEILKS